MTPESSEILAPEAQLAIAHTAPILRGALTIFFELDHRLARIVGATSEPMLGQMRLAWWREMLGKPVEERPSGDAVLDGIGEHWRGHEGALGKLVDGWEHMLADTLDREAALKFASGKAAGLAHLAVMQGKNGSAENLLPALQRWALVDAAAHVSEGAERDLLLSLAGEIDASPSYLRGLRGLAVLDALAKRALDRGGRPLMEGRGAALVALRAAIIGR